MSYNLPNQIIDASGNKIGIGTTSPEYRLDVRSSGAHSQVFAVQGTQGRLLSVDDNLSSGTLFSVANITGLPSFEVSASGDVDIAEFGNSITTHRPILISGGVPVSTNNKLYNDNGVLKWNGNTIVAGLGASSGVAFYNTSGVLTSSSSFTYDGVNTLTLKDDATLIEFRGADDNLGLTIGDSHDNTNEGGKIGFYWQGDGRGWIKSGTDGITHRISSDKIIRIEDGANSEYAKFYGTTTDKAFEIISPASTTVLQTYQGASAQSANLTEWKDSAGDNLATVTNSGFFETSEGMYIYGSGKPGDTSYHRLFIGKDNYSYDKYKIGSEGASKNIDFYYGSTKVMTISGQIYACRDVVPVTNNSKKLGDSRRWSEVNTADISISGVTTFLQDDGSATDIFYSGNSLVMELPNKHFEIRGKDGNQFINFSDAGNNAVNVGTSLYPVGNKQKSFGYPTLRWKTLYGGNADLETFTNGTPTLILRKIGGQTADLTQWQDASSNVLAYVDKDGHAHFPSLSVSGDFTYVNSENVTIFDKQIELASLSGSAVSGDALVDEGGFVLKSTDGDKQFIWRDYDDAWTSNQNISLTSGNGIYVYNSGAGNTDYERLRIGSTDNSKYDIKSQTLNGSLHPINIDSNQVNIKYQGGNRLRVGSSSISSWTNIQPNSDGGSSLGLTSTRWNQINGKSIDTEAGSATDVPATFTGASSQSANLTEWKDSAGDALTVVGADGHMTIGSGESTSYPLAIRNSLGETGNASRGLEIKVRHNSGTLPDRAQFIIRNRADNKVPLAIHFSSSNTPYIQAWGANSLHINRFQNSDGNNVSTYIGNYGNNTPFKQEYGTGRVGISTKDPDYTLHVRGDIHGSGRFIDSDENAGAAGQVLTSTVTGTSWGDLPATTGTPSGVAFFGDDASLTNVDKLVYASGYDGDNLEHGYHLYKTGAGTANWERAEIGWGRTGGQASDRFYIGLNEGGTGSNSIDMRIAARQIDFRTGTDKDNDILKLGTSSITTYLRVVPGVANNTGDTLGHTTKPYGRLFLGDLDGSLRFNNDTYIGRPASGVLVVTSGTGYDNAVFRAGRFEAEGAHTAVTPLEVKGAISQTANLTEWKDGVGDTLASVDSAANLYVSGQLQYGTHGQKIYSNSSSTTRYYSSYHFFRGGGHSVNFNTNSNGWVGFSSGHKVGWHNNPTQAAVPVVYLRHYNLDSVAVETSAGLATLIASGVNTSGVYLADHVPVDTTDTIYNSGGTMTWDGAFAAETKSFLIDHPTREDMKLQYGSLEGPENGVYVRGSTNGVIELPDYWTGLVDEESITVQLTPKSHPQNTYVSGIMNNRVYLISDTDIDVYYNVYGTRKDVAPLEVEW